MTIPQLYELNGEDRDVVSITTQFIHDRLDDLAIACWALDLKLSQRAERAALWDCYQFFRTKDLKEPWLTFWGWVFESWENAPAMRLQARANLIGIRIQRGDRSRTTIDEIIDTVRPYPRISAQSRSSFARNRKRKPRTVLDIVSITVSSGELINPSVLHLDNVDARFLAELGNGLEGAVRYGLDIDRRLGDGGKASWRLGSLRRAYPVRYANKDDSSEDPDEFNRGIAPSAKLLFSVVDCLALNDSNLAQQFLRRWREDTSFVFVRLWAAFARSESLVGDKEVEEFLESTSQEQFWDLYEYPEIAELRARRFSSLSSKSKMRISRRLMRLPPRHHWPKDLDSDKRAVGQIYWAVRELKRIELAGGTLPAEASTWVAGHLERVPELKTMTNVEDGFPRGTVVTWTGAIVNSEFDSFSGDFRLRALENALGEARTFESNAAAGARAWINAPQNLSLIVEDLEGASEGGKDFPRVWEILTWVLPAAGGQASAQLDQALAARIFSLIQKLPNDTRSLAIDGIAAWLSSWSRLISDHARLAKLWFELWPQAVFVTNARGEDTLAFDTADDDDERKNNIDTLNSPAGKLVGVFLEICPDLKQVPAPFAEAPLKEMRQRIFEAPGRSGLIGRVRLLEELEYFLLADVSWAREKLIGALREETVQRAILWRALANRTHFAAVAEVGSEMASVAINNQYDRTTRKVMAFTLVAYLLNCFWRETIPAIEPTLVQQVLRAADDEIRAHSANVLNNFIQGGVSAAKSDQDRNALAGAIFEKSIRPLLEQVWPQERSLTSPGVAKALADLPASCGIRFAEAVDAVTRFIVPFEAWSMLEFGFYGANDDEPQLARIDDPLKAEAFLKLLDLSIGHAEGAIVPYEIGGALARIALVNPPLEHDQRFRRLSALSRR